MSDTATTAADATKRLGQDDAALKRIYLDGKRYTDEELAELVDCLLAHPDIAKEAWLGHNQLTDETGVKLARYLAASTTIEWLSLNNNQFGEATYLAVAAALRVNTSLLGLCLHGSQPTDVRRVDAAFVEALRINPKRPAGSRWWLFAYGDQDADYKRLRLRARSKAGASLYRLFGRSAEPSSAADERVQQLERQVRERDDAIAVMQAQLRDVQALLEATQRQLLDMQAQLLAQTQLPE